MNRPLYGLMLVAMVTLAACASEISGISVQGIALIDVDLIQGHILYTAWCAGCHGDKGEGQFPGTPLEPSPVTQLYGAPPHNPTGHSWHHSDDLLVRYVIEGGFTDPTAFYPMPGFGRRMSEQDARRLIGYIKTLWTDEQRMMQARTTEEEMALMAGQ